MGRKGVLTDRFATRGKNITIHHNINHEKVGAWVQTKKRKVSVSAEDQSGGKAWTPITTSAVKGGQVRGIPCLDETTEEG